MTERLQYMQDLDKRLSGVAAMSPCDKRKVGAVIIDSEGKELSFGFNHHPSGMPCEEGNITDSAVVHAEIDAMHKLIGVGYEDFSDCAMFITHPPCDNCRAALASYGLDYGVSNGFLKFDNSKLRYSLIPPKTTKELAKVLTYGAKKYKPNNWKNADDTTRYIDALYRHLESWRSGESFDDESGLSHLSHALTNIAFLIEFEDIK